MEEKSKIKLFIDNFLVYGFGGIISKIIPLIMVPVVTRLMPSSEYYGINDMSNTIQSFASYICIMGLYDAMYRMFFDNSSKEYKIKLCSTTFLFNITTSALVCIIMILCRNQLASFFFNNRKHSFIIYITAIATFVGSTNSIVSAPTRMQNKRKIFLITNTVSPVISYIISIPLLLKGYYLVALPLAGLVSSFLNEIIFWRLNTDWFKLNQFDKSMLKPLLRLGIPLMPNFLIYWIFSSCDRVMISKFLSIGDTGIYTVGSMLSQASQLIYTAFAGGWQYFSFYTMNDEKQVENNSRIFEYLGVLSFITTFFICAFSEVFYIVLFKDEYHRAFIVSPYLYLAPLMQMLFQVATSQFLIIKNTWPVLFLLGSGAIFNILLNAILIPNIGIEGAAIATLVGYTVATVSSVAILQHMQLIRLSFRFYIASGIMIWYFVVWRNIILHNLIAEIIFAMISAIWVLYFYRKDIKEIYKKIKLSI